jgi:hypothetical protein
MARTCGPGRSATAYRLGRNAQQAVVEVGVLLYRGHKAKLAKMRPIISVSQ